MTTESVPASSPAKKIPIKTKKAGGKAKTAPAAHPPYQAMVKAAVKNIKDRQGASRAAILKYIVLNYSVGLDGKKISAHLRSALKRGVSGGALKQAKGTGANGRFRLSDSAKKTSPKKKAPKPKPAAKKPAAKEAAKKTSPKKKTVAKKAASPKKAQASPKKAKAPAKKTKSPAKKTKSPAKKASPKKAVKKTKTPKKAAPKKA